MIDLIIWSKDRAAQLDLLLRSLEEFMPNTFNVNVVFTYSDEKYRMAYNNVLSTSPVAFHMKDETNFRKDTMLNIENKLSNNDLVAFATDDTVLIRPAEFKTEYMDNVSVFSLRLGFNTIEQDIHAGTQQPPLTTYDDEDQTMSWFFSDYHPHHNYGYPFGLDMHVYHREELYNIMRYIPFKNTKELESALFHKRLCIKPKMRSFKQSVAVNVPVNSISGVTRAGEIHASATEYLNEEYLKGRRLSLDALSKEKIVGCHQEINLEWISG